MFKCFARSVTTELGNLKKKQGSISGIQVIAVRVECVFLPLQCEFVSSSLMIMKSVQVWNAF